VKESLKPGLRHQSTLLVTEQHLVPALFPESPESQIRPPVFATGFLVGFLELACVELIIPHLDWPEEQAVGTMINVTHQAATPAGMLIVATAELTAVNGRKLSFFVQAHDGIDLVSQGTHERMIIDRRRFTEKTYQKLELA
jgi:fluoroacetyl-CoA thioesterase